jgi:hypothetical protein
MIEPAAAPPHAGDYRLGGEELVPQIDRDPLVPIGGGDVLDPMPVVVGGVVDQHGDVAVSGRHFRNGRLQRLDVPQIAADEAGLRAFDPELTAQGLSCLRLDVEKRHPRPLAAELADEAGADPRSAARDQHGTTAQARIDRQLPHSVPRRICTWQGLPLVSGARQAGETA